MSPMDLYFIAGRLAALIGLTAIVKLAGVIQVRDLVSQASSYHPSKYHVQLSSLAVSGLGTDGFARSARWTSSAGGGPWLRRGARGGVR